ncbi:GPI inositol-deacylase isoform X4 [Parasteatoda tepidariorum]
MGHSLHSSNHFNFFTINFNEEISGLYGGTLMEQTYFVNECINHILNMYPTNKKIILIGHSMGGVLSEAIFSLPSFDSSIISLIITLAAPLKAPVIVLDEKTAEFYKMIHEAWKYRLRSSLMNVPLVSIGGGDRDILVRSDLTFNEFKHKSILDVTAMTNSIPGVWVSADHLAITWCKQLILTICRSLFDLIDPQTNQITSKPDVIEKVLKYHYVRRPSGKHYSRLPSVPIGTFPPSGQWIEQDSNAWRFSRSKVLSAIYLLIPITHDDSILIIATGLVKKEWIYGCTELSKSEMTTCSVGENLSDKGQIIPSKSKKGERRMIVVDSEELKDKKYLYLLVYITPLDSQVDIIGERFNSNLRSKNIELPSLIQRFFKPPVRLLSVSLPEQSIFFNITLKNSYGIYESTELQLETRLCRAGSVVGQGLVKIHLPCNNEDSYHHIRTTMGGLTTIPVKPHTLPSFESGCEVHLELYLDPECSIVLYAKFPFYLASSQFMKYNAPYIIGYIVSIGFAFLAGQLYIYSSSGYVPSFYQIFGHYPTYVTLVAVPTFIFHLIWIPDLSIIYIPPIDIIGQKDITLLHTLLLRTFLYLISCGSVIILYTAINLFLSFTCKIWIMIKRNTLMEISEVRLELERKIRIGVTKPLMVWCAMVAATSIGLSGSIGIQLTCLFYLYKLVCFRMRCIAEEDRRGPSTSTTVWYFHFTIFFLLLLFLGLTFPSFVMWLKSNQFTLRTPNDINGLQCIIVIVTSHYFWELPTPCFYRSHYTSSSHIMHFLAVISTMYGISSLYRLTYYIAIGFLSLAVCQTLSYINGLSHLA